MRQSAANRPAIAREARLLRRAIARWKKTWPLGGFRSAAIFSIGDDAHDLNGRAVVQFVCVTKRGGNGTRDVTRKAFVHNCHTRKSAVIAMGEFPAGEEASAGSAKIFGRDFESGGAKGGICRCKVSRFRGNCRRRDGRDCGLLLR